MRISNGTYVEVELLGTEGVHDRIEDTELTSGQGTDHDATRSKTGSSKLEEAHFASDVGQAG